MAYVRLCSFAPDQDLRSLGDKLKADGIDHRWEPYENGVYLVIDDRHLAGAVHVLQGERYTVPPPPKEQMGNSLMRTWQLWPLTVITVLLGLLGYLAVTFDSQWILVRHLTFNQLLVGFHDIRMLNFEKTYLIDHQWWRIWTPAFLHFGLFHVMFNGLAIWELGRRLELCLGQRWYLLTLVATAAGANIAQYVFVGPSLFGGLSGVVFGLLGMIAVLYWRSKLALLRLPPGLYVLASISLLAGPLGLFERFFGISIADGAHFGGLAVGALLGLLVPGRYFRGTH